MAALFIDPDASSDAGKDEYSIIHFQYSHQSGIRKIPTDHIYKQTLLSRFNILRRDKIKTVEGDLFVNKYKDVYLLSRDDIRSYRSKFKFLHIGLVQFSIDSNFFREAAVSVSLRDSKYPNLKDSVLVSLESTELPIKFNWFPNFSSPLSDLANSNALVVTINSPTSSASLPVDYRVCYKLMKTSLKPDYLFENPVLEVNTENTNVVVPKNQA